MTDFKHGRNGYAYHKCRCDICKEATSVYRRGLRQERKTKTTARLDPEPFLYRVERAGRLSEIHPTYIARWRKNGMDIYWADYWAIRFGWHPAEIWGMAFYAGVEVTDAA